MSFHDHMGGLAEVCHDFQLDISCLVDGELERILALLDEGSRTPEAIRDAVSTRLMEVFRLTTSRGCFGLLYELNSQHLLVQVAGRLRRYSSKADPLDVLQEVWRADPRTSIVGEPGRVPSPGKYCDRPSSTVS